MKSNEIIKRPSLREGVARFELLHEDVEGNVLSYESNEMPGFMHRPSAQREMPLTPFLGPIGGALIVIPTVGHAKFATDIGALTGWQMAIGIGTDAEAAGNTAMSSEITTYGGARASVTPTVLTNVVTWTKQWTFTTGASFAVIEAGVFKDTTLMMRHLYSVAKNVVTTDKLTATLTDTL
jgi:hypothetical protein